VRREHAYETCLLPWILTGPGIKIANISEK
jgi:hypothetical protein